MTMALAGVTASCKAQPAGCGVGVFSPACFIHVNFSLVRGCLSVCLSVYVCLPVSVCRRRRHRQPRLLHPRELLSGARVCVFMCLCVCFVCGLR